MASVSLSDTSAAVLRFGAEYGGRRRFVARLGLASVGGSLSIAQTDLATGDVTGVAATADKWAVIILDPGPSFTVAIAVSGSASSVAGAVAR